MTPAVPPIDSDGLFPWRYFVRVLESVFQLRVLLLAALGAYLSAAGDAVLQLVAGESMLAGGVPVPAPLSPWPEWIQHCLGGPIRHWLSVTLPFGGPVGSGVAGVAFGLWRLAVWAFFAGAIAQAAGLRLTHSDAPPWVESLRSALRLWPIRMAPLVTLLLLVGASLAPLWLHGWLLHVETLSFISALLLPVALVFTLAAAALAVCVAICWPLMIVSPAIEPPDPFESVSRGVAYATQKPFQLAAYLLTALVVATPVGMLLELVSAAGVQFSIVGLGLLDGEPSRGYALATFWVKALFGYLPTIFYAAYFWCASVAIYLLLRRDVDGVQVDEMEAAEVVCDEKRE